MITTVVIIIAIVVGSVVTYELDMWHFPAQAGSVVTTTQSQQSTNYQTQWQTQTVTAPASTLGMAGAWCTLTITKPDYNMGEVPTGYFQSNRPNTQFAIAIRLRSESNIIMPITETTDGSGNRVVISPQPIETPGILDVGAGLIFGPTMNDVVPCTPAIQPLTVHGFKISVNPDSVPVGVSSTITIELFSDRPNAHMTIEWRDSNVNPPWWAVYMAATTNAAGHAIITVPDFLSAHATGFIFRGHDANVGDYTTNEEWLAVN